MKNKEILTICFSLLVITGTSLSLDFYNNAVHPLDVTEEHLKGVLGSSDVSQIQEHLAKVRQNLSAIIEKLPEDKNPVWLFPTESTDFLRIKSDADRMAVSLDKLSGLPKDTSAYHTGMLDIHERANLLRENLLDAKSFMYASATNIFFTLVWVGGVAGIMRTWMKNEN